MVVHRSRLTTLLELFSAVDRDGGILPSIHESEGLSGLQGRRRSHAESLRWCILRFYTDLNMDEPIILLDYRFAQQILPRMPRQ